MASAATFSGTGGDVSLHLRPIHKGPGADAEVVRGAVGQVLELEPERAAALHVHHDGPTDAWGGGGGVETVGTGRGRLCANIPHSQRLEKLCVAQHRFKSNIHLKSCSTAFKGVIICQATVRKGRRRVVPSRGVQGS